jgi:hypothetical protein
MSTSFIMPFVGPSSHPSGRRHVRLSRCSFLVLPFFLHILYKSNVKPILFCGHQFLTFKPFYPEWYSIPRRRGSSHRLDNMCVVDILQYAPIANSGSIFIESALEKLLLLSLLYFLESDNQGELWLTVCLQKQWYQSKRTRLRNSKIVYKKLHDFNSTAKRPQSVQFLLASNKGASTSV